MLYPKGRILLLESKLRYLTNGKFAKFKMVLLLYFLESLNDSLYHIEI